MVNMETTVEEKKVKVKFNDLKFKTMDWTQRFWFFVLLILCTFIASVITVQLLQPEPEFINRPQPNFVEEIARYFFLLELALLYIFSLCAAFCMGAKKVKPND